jgi:hypothetical protein
MIFLMQFKQGRVDYGTKYRGFDCGVSLDDHARHSNPNPHSQQKIG